MESRRDRCLSVQAATIFASASRSASARMVSVIFCLRRRRSEYRLVFVWFCVSCLCVFVELLGFSLVFLQLALDVCEVSMSFLWFAVKLLWYASKGKPKETKQNQPKPIPLSQAQSTIPSILVRGAPPTPVHVRISRLLSSCARRPAV